MRKMKHKEAESLNPNQICGTVYNWSLRKDKSSFLLSYCLSHKQIGEWFSNPLPFTIPWGVSKDTGVQVQPQDIRYG